MPIGGGAGLQKFERRGNNTSLGLSILDDLDRFAMSCVELMEDSSVGISDKEIIRRLHQVLIPVQAAYNLLEDATGKDPKEVERAITSSYMVMEGRDRRR